MSWPCATRSKPTPDARTKVPAITSPEDVHRLLGAEMGALCQEQVRVLLLDRRNRVVGQRVIYQGNAYSTVVRPAEVLSARRWWRASPTSSSPTTIPRGDPSPSPQDINVTKELVRRRRSCSACTLLDPVVIGGREAVSLKDRGLLD